MRKRLSMVIFALVVAASVPTVREAAASYCPSWDCFDKYCTYCFPMYEEGGVCQIDWEGGRPCCTSDPSFCPVI
jgi:hypothetical protein